RHAVIQPVHRTAVLEEPNPFQHDYAPSKAIAWLSAGADSREQSGPPLRKPQLYFDHSQHPECEFIGRARGLQPVAERPAVCDLRAACGGPVELSQCELSGELRPGALRV